MAGTGAIGLVAVFFVDLLNLFYIALLGNRALTAAVGFTGAVGYFMIAIGIGLTIGVGAVVSRTLGAGQIGRARRIATASLVVMVALMLALGGLVAVAMHPILRALGASGDVAAQAWHFLVITTPSVPLMAMGMVSGALLRSVGDARGAMYVSLAGAAVTAAIDPVLILWAHLGLFGAALSMVAARATMAGLGLARVRRHGLLTRPDWRRMLADARCVGRVAAPAVLTNLATPVGGAFVTHTLARFGPAAVAGVAVADRIVPVAFGFVFALSGAVGPIMAQNLGAKQFGRVRETLRASLLLVLTWTLAVWAALFLGQNVIVRLFGVNGEAADLVRLFCTWTAGSMLFLGALFVANAGFNNLGQPILATTFNWGRATLGTLPFVSIGARYGAVGAILGYALGGVVFGTLAVLTAFWVTRRLDAGARPGLAIALPAGSGRAASLELAQADAPGDGVTPAAAS